MDIPRKDYYTTKNKPKELESFRVSDPFNVTITINFRGHTIADGNYNVTPNMIVDKITSALDEQIKHGFIIDFVIIFKEKRYYHRKKIEIEETQEEIEE